MWNWKNEYCTDKINETMKWLNKRNLRISLNNQTYGSQVSEVSMIGHIIRYILYFYRKTIKLKPPTNEMKNFNLQAEKFLWSLNYL